MLLELQVDLLWHRVLRVIVCDSLHQASWIVTAENDMHFDTLKRLSKPALPVEMWFVA